MKKTYMLILAGILGSLCVDVFAAAAGNMVNFPEKGKFSAGYEYTNVDNRDIVEYDGGALWIIESSERNVGKISYGVWENVVLDLLYGRASLDLEAENGGGDPGMKFDAGDTWGVGIRTKLYEDIQRNLVLGGGFSYQDFSNDNAIRHVSNDPFSSQAEEWHLSFDLARMFASGGIYGAIRYSECTIPYTHVPEPTPRIGGFKETDNFGVALGGEVKFAKRVSLCVEKTFLDEDAYSAGVYFRF